MKEQSKESRCSRTACIEEGPYYFPTLLLRATPMGAQAKGSLPLKICRKHRASTTLADLGLEENWDMVCAQFALNGSAAPVLELTEIEWNPA